MIHHDRGTKRSVQGQNRPSAPPGRFLWNVHFCPFVSGLPVLPRFVHWPAGRPIIRRAGSSTTDLIRLPPARIPLRTVAATNNPHSRLDGIFMPPRHAAVAPATNDDSGESGEGAMPPSHSGMMRGAGFEPANPYGTGF